MRGRMWLLFVGEDATFPWVRLDQFGAANYTGAAATVLGAVGLYGLLSTVVARRSREFGIRYALGAARSRVMRGVVGEALTLVLGGGVLGVLLALASGDLIAGLVFGIDPRDPLTLLAAPLLLTVVGLVAAWVRFSTPSARRMLVTCTRTVEGLICSSSAISLLESPRPRSRSTSVWRGVRRAVDPSEAWERGGGAPAARRLGSTWGGT